MTILSLCERRSLLALDAAVRAGADRKGDRPCQCGAMVSEHSTAELLTCAFEAQEAVARGKGPA